jgi:CHAD domain-containing protein
MNMNKETETFVPKSAKTPELASDMPCRGAALRSLDFYFRNFLWNERGVRIGIDPEFLHYFRVASKRLNTVLNVFKDYFPENDISRYKSTLKSLAPVLGKARDTDVYLEFLNDKVSREMGQKELKVFNKYKNFFLRRKKSRQKAVLKKLDSEDYKLFVHEFTNFISRISTMENISLDSPVSAIIDRSIRTKLEKLLNYSKKLNNKSSDSKLHGFRKKCRKLRYEVELSLNITGDHGMELDRKLIEFQRSLGSHHDAVTAGIKLKSFLKTHKEYSKSRAMKKLGKLQEERAIKLRRKFFGIFFHSNKFLHEFI